MAYRILVVDDEPSIITLVKYNLEKSGFEVNTANDGKEALELCNFKQYDLIILDIMLPEIDGIEVLKGLRKNNIYTPVILLTAKDEEIDKVIGLELGADDYITKPFSPRELIARVKAILRRLDIVETKKQDIDKQQLIYTIGDLVIYGDRYEVVYKGAGIELKPKEFELLLYLVKNKGKVFTRDQLLDAIWHYDYLGDSRIVDVNISYLRDKIERDTKKPEFIKTIRGIGYKFEDKKNEENKT
ncbi:MAG: response regulator transcription factor [Vulcanibacillus sp.]